MEPPDGPPIASGRAADVFDLGDGTVLRRYRAEHETQAEARLMSWAADAGLPVPRVHRSDGRDLVMDRIEGPTMLDAIVARPWTALRHAATLASLQRQIGALRAPEWVRPARTGPPGGALLHLDLHPMNVLLSPDGPIVIDWTNAARGPAALDAGYSYVLMATFEAGRSVERAGRRLFADAFAARRGRATVRALLDDACELRLRDPATTAAERSSILALRRSRTTR